MECARGYVGSLKQFTNNDSTDSMHQESTQEPSTRYTNTLILFTCRFSLSLSRSQLVSLQCYTHDCLSCLVHCSSDKELSEEDDKQLALWAVAQVPMDTSPLEWEGLMSHDDIMSVSLDDQVLDRSVNHNITVTGSGI